MKFNFSKFNSSELENSDLFPISGGSSRTQSGQTRTACAGADSDLAGDDRCG